MRTPEWYLHCAINALTDAKGDGDPEEIAEAEADLAQLEADSPEAAERIRAEHPRRGWADISPVGSQLTAVAPARKPRAILRTEDFTAPGRAVEGYVIKGILGRRSYAELFGAPGEGKTFAALDMAYAVAQGREWMGRRVTGGLVLYVPFEGAGGLTKRVRALVQRHGHAPKFRVIENPDYNLREMKGRQALGQDLTQLPEKPVLIVVDTLAHALMGGDENSAQDVGAFNSAIAALIDNTGATVLLIHHSGKDRGKGSRGSSALLGAIDTELEASGGAIHSRKQRDTEVAAPIGFRLVPVVVGQDEDGEEIVSCVLEPTSAARAAGSRQAWKEDSTTGRAFKKLCELSADNAPVAEDVWRNGCREFLAAKSLAARFYDAKTRLRTYGAIEETSEGARLWRRKMYGGETAEISGEEMATALLEGGPVPATPKRQRRGQQ
jgi:hypothetical protein